MADENIVDAILKAIELCPQAVREGFFAFILRERFCVHCGALVPTCINVIAMQEEKMYETRSHSP